MTKEDFGRFVLYDILISSLVFGCIKKTFSSDLLAIFGSFVVPIALKKTTKLIKG